MLIFETMNGDDDEKKDGDINDEMTLTANDGGPRLTWLPSASGLVNLTILTLTILSSLSHELPADNDDDVGNNYSEDCDGDRNDDGEDHSLLLLVGVAGRDGPALTFAALWLHIHLQLLVILMISWFSWWYVAILIIFLTMMRHSRQASWQFLCPTLLHFPPCRRSPSTKDFS